MPIVVCKGLLVTKALWSPRFLITKSRICMACDARYEGIARSREQKWEGEKKGKFPPPLTLQHVPPEAYLLAYEQALLRFPGVRGWGREESPRRACSRILTCRLYTYRFTTVLRCSRSDASLAQRTRKVSTTSSPRLSPYISDDDGDGNEIGQKVIGLE